VVAHPCDKERRMDGHGAIGPVELNLQAGLVLRVGLRVGHRVWLEG
jgi:hypothetical protein